MTSNESGHYRGLHVVVINPNTGKVDFKNVFDTNQSSEALETFIDTGITEGFIIVAACKDDCVTNMSDKVVQWFADMGSKEIYDLKYRQGFAFIGLSNRK